jgi:hypothetical protein
MWTNIAEALPEPGQRLKVVGRQTPDPVAAGFLRAVYMGSDGAGRPVFRSSDPRAEKGITEWCPVNMDYEDEEDWTWAN